MCIRDSRYGGQRQYMVPPEKTHETFVYCFAAAARFCRPGFRASGRFRNRGVPFRSRGASFRNGSVLFRRRSVPLCSRSVPLCSRGAPFCSRSVPLCSRGVAFRSRDAPFLSRGFFRFRFLSLVFRPRFFRVPPLRRFCCDCRLHLFSVRFRCRHMRYFAAVVSPAGAEAAGACGITSESSCVMRSSSFTSPFSSAAMLSLIHI